MIFLENIKSEGCLHNNISFYCFYFIILDVDRKLIFVRIVILLKLGIAIVKGINIKLDSQTILFSSLCSLIGLGKNNKASNIIVFNLLIYIFESQFIYNAAFYNS